MSGTVRHKDGGGPGGDPRGGPKGPGGPNGPTGPASPVRPGPVQGSDQGSVQGSVQGSLPRTELDDLLEELRTRIDAVRGTRARIHGLLGPAHHKPPPPPYPLDLPLPEAEGSESESESEPEPGAEDETVLSALSTAAGMAIENARLYEEARYRQRWMEANAEVTQALLSGRDEQTVLALIVELARTILSADLGVLALPEESGETLAVAVAAGTDAGHHSGLRLPREGSLAGAAMAAGEVTTSADVENDPRVTAGPPRWAGLGPAVAVPMTAEDVPRGVLLLARRKPRSPFDEPQTAPLSAFAAQAAVAMELAERRREAEQITLLEERDRIARDLHDLAIQRLFATGMTLQSAVPMVEHPKAGERLLRAVDDLDATIRIIRSTIFGLRAHDDDPSDEGLRRRVSEAVGDVASALGFTPQLRMEGLLDTEVPGGTADEAVAVLREALSNVARHAGAGSVEVTVESTGGTFTLSVVDDGSGIPEGTRRSGLANLCERAERLGGGMRLGTPSGGGTSLTWRVPLNGTDSR